MTSTDNGNEIITRDFLQKALQEEAGLKKAQKIESYTTTPGTQLGDNYMSTIYSVEVKLVNGQTRHFFVKCFPNNPTLRKFVQKRNFFFKELKIYSKWIPELRKMASKFPIKLPYAPFVHGKCTDFQTTQKEQINFHENFIVLEVVRKTMGFRMTNRRDTLDIHHMQLVMRALATVHSLSWVYRIQDASDITKKFLCFQSTDTDEYIEARNKLVGLNLDQGISIYDQEFGSGNQYTATVETFRKYLPILGRFFAGTSTGEQLERVWSSDFGKKCQKLSQYSVPWRVISHGDCWSNNMLFKYDPETGKPYDIILVDLQLAKETCVVNDLVYVFYACTDVQLRRQHTQELLQLYYDTFNEICDLMKIPTLPGFNMDSLQFRFYRAKPLGYYIATLCLPIILKEETNVVNSQKSETSDTLRDMFGSQSNPILKKRLTGVTTEMIEDNVFI